MNRNKRLNHMHMCSEGSNQSVYAGEGKWVISDFFQYSEDDDDDKMCIHTYAEEQSLFRVEWKRFRKGRCNR